MHLELRDLQSSKTLKVDGERVLGREGAPNDIPIADRTVSSQHARLFSQGGQWFVEDLGSSNGTFVKGARITGPARLEAGVQFALCRYAFEVVRVEGAEGTNATFMFGDTALEGSRPDTMPQARGGASRDRASDRGAAVGGGAAGAAPFLSHVLAAQPSAWAFYLTAAPKMLLHPIASVRRAIDEQPLPALGSKELAAYALPPLLLSALIGSAAGIIAGAVNGSLGAGLLVDAIVRAAVALVVAVISAFIFHPILRWLIEILHGESDDKSRSNYFVSVLTATPLTALAGGVGSLLALAPLPFVGLAAPLLSLATTLIMVMLLYAWFRYFEVARVATLVIAALAVVASVVIAVGAADLIRADIARLRADAAPAAVLVAAEPEPPTLGSAHTSEAVPPGGVLPPMAATTPSVGSGATPPTNAAPAAAPVSEAAPSAAAQPPAASETAAVPGEAAASTDYQEWLKRREAIESAIERDPTLLKKKGVLALYKELHKRAITVQQKYRAKPVKKQTPDSLAEAKVAERLAEAEAYQATAEIVEKLYKKVFDR